MGLAHVVSSVERSWSRRTARRNSLRRMEKGRSRFPVPASECRYRESSALPWRSHAAPAYRWPIQHHALDDRVEEAIRVVEDHVQRLGGDTIDWEIPNID